MGERKRKERKRDPPKKTEQLPPLPLAKDRSLATKQRNFCKNVVTQILDDDSSLSFSKPVDVLWERSVLTDYFERIKQPMDLGTVLNTASSATGYISKDTGFFDVNSFRLQVRLVFLNALEYNAKGTDLARLAARFLQFIDAQMTDIPVESPSEDEKDQDSADASKSAKGEKKRAKEEDPTDKSENADDENGEMEEDAKDAPMDDSEVEKLNTHIASLVKKKAQSEAALAELELMKNVPLTFEENSKLRDEVESLPWEKAQKVAHILRKYVDEALRENKEEDPEFVTLEFSTVEPRLLRDIEALIRPDPRVEKERKAIAALDEEITSTKRKLKPHPDRETSAKKKQRRRR